MTHITHDAGPASLDPADLIEEGRRAAADREGRPLQFLEALERLTSSAQAEAELTPIGRAVLHDTIVKDLTTQLHAARLAEQHPEITGLPIEAPVIITGMPRTGTTALHNLLAEIPGLRAPRLWELLAPASPDTPEQLVAAAEQYVGLYYAAAPIFELLHPVGALAPDECHRLIAGTFSSEIYPQRYLVPSYARWLAGRGRLAEYRYHRLLLSCILWRSPGGRPLLKCPTHLGHLDDLAAVYPGARVIRLHRDLARCLTSACGLTAVTQGLSRGQVDREKLGRRWLEVAGPLLARQRRGEDSVPGIAILDIRQEDLLADPLAIAQQICEFADVPLPPAARERLREHVTRSAAAGPGGHRFTLAEFGLDAGEIDRRFAEYRAEFGL